MTIRLRCAECQRKLKVPDEALGKKVQCPACGARFIGRLDSNPPPSPPQEPAVTEPAPASALPEPAALFPNLQLEESSPIKPIEPLAIDEPVQEEPVGIDEVEVTEAPPLEDEGVDPIVMEDEPVVDFYEIEDETEAIEELEEVEDEIEPEIVDEEEAAEEAKPRPKKPKSRAKVFVWLAVGLVLLLVCLAGAYAVYGYINGTLFESNQKQLSPPVQPQLRNPPVPPPQPTPPGQRG